MVFQDPVLPLPYLAPTMALSFSDDAVGARLLISAISFKSFLEKPVLWQTWPRTGDQGRRDKNWTNRANAVVHLAKKYFRVFFSSVYFLGVSPPTFFWPKNRFLRRSELSLNIALKKKPPNGQEIQNK